MRRWRRCRCAGGTWPRGPPAPRADSRPRLGAALRGRPRAAQAPPATGGGDLARSRPPSDRTQVGGPPQALHLDLDWGSPVKPNIARPTGRATGGGSGSRVSVYLGAGGGRRGRRHRAASGQGTGDPRCGTARRWLARHPAPVGHREPRHAGRAAAARRFRAGHANLRRRAAPAAEGRQRQQRGRQGNGQWGAAVTCRAHGVRSTRPRVG